MLYMYTKAVGNISHYTLNVETMGSIRYYALCTKLCVTQDTMHCILQHQLLCTNVVVTMSYNIEYY